jgi:hypothetical protein
MLPIPNQNPNLQIVGHLKGEPVFAIDEPRFNLEPEQMLAPTQKPNLYDLLDQATDLVENFEVVHKNLIEEIKGVGSSDNLTAELCLNKAATLSGLNREVTVSGISIMHLQAIIGAANQVLG